MSNLQFYLDEFAKDDLIYLFLPLFFLALAIEFIIDRRKNLGLFEKKDTIASMWMMVFVLFVDFLPKLAALVAFYYLHSISPLADIVQRQWWAWVLLFFLDDITYYFMHRSNHEVRLLWAGHVSHHRVHHASNIRYLDCNHAGALIIWDKLFGTFSEEAKGEPPVYGLTTNITSYNPFSVALHEYSAIVADVKRAQRFRDKLSYILKAPGWSHDGEDRRAKVLRAKALQA